MKVGLAAKFVLHIKVCNGLCRRTVEHQKEKDLFERSRSEKNCIHLPKSIDRLLIIRNGDVHL